MRSAYENAAEDDPESYRCPSEFGRKDRTHDRSGTCDCREMVPEEHRRMGWDEVDAVFLRVSGSRDRRVNPELALY